eukprot:1004314-Prymnesium_polylepis.2
MVRNLTCGPSSVFAQIAGLGGTRGGAGLPGSLRVTPTRSHCVSRIHTSCESAASARNSRESTRITNWFARVSPGYHLDSPGCHHQHHSSGDRCETV